MHFFKYISNLNILLLDNIGVSIKHNFRNDSKRSSFSAKMYYFKIIKFRIYLEFQQS